jgi:hypothetical protein
VWLVTERLALSHPGDFVSTPSDLGYGDIGNVIHLSYDPLDELLSWRWYGAPPRMDTAHGICRGSLHIHQGEGSLWSKALGSC